MENWLKFRVGDDGSLRDATYLAGDSLAVFPEMDSHGRAILSVGMRPQRNFGLEIIIDPYPYSELQQLAQKIAHYLSCVPQNPRTSIHIHVDADGNTWKEVRRLLLWVRALEAVIFRVACGGDVHRGARAYNGEPNDHRYARPLSAPIGVHTSGGKVRPLIDWNGIKNATSASEMVAAWGRLDTYWNNGFEHYMPHRLHMVNIASILRQGTIEWRVFDGLYRHFDQLLAVVYAVHQLAGAGDPDFDFPLGSEPKIDAEWVSRLLDTDVSQLWGNNWQKPCIRPTPLSHYNNAPVLASVHEINVRQISNGRVRDSGESNFVLYHR
jgi:hypothetical protein